ncbi:MAG: 4-(cytidine 5'-diphospho)-2-C-methyl-D-erythritol kinase [Chloroflexi bacterium]|nr:4-(cytidine 5'-diphospho)-2-C-methyl-D-erythritol kinase [Chloroflexota bacterium]
MRVKAPAKINLCLEVIGKRADGYHNVATVLHTLDLADELTFEPAEGLSLQCQPPVGSEEENLVMRAARLLRQETGCTQGAAISVTKHIPIAAGLGGGSSDGAATLLALDALWGLGLSRERLAGLAASLGADAPFFLDGPCALAKGRGDLLTPLPRLQGWWAVLLCPPIALEGKTGRLFGMLTPSDYSDGSAAGALAQQIGDGSASQGDFAMARNAFERVADQAFPGLERYRRAFLAAGAPFVRLSGSGPSIFTLVGGAPEGQRLAASLHARGFEAHVAALV